MNMLRKNSRLVIRPYHVKPARLTKDGRFTCKEAVRVYLDHLRVGLLRAGKLPSEEFGVCKETMQDFAGQLDEQAVLMMRKKK